jgi:hypothetical protein
LLDRLVQPLALDPCECFGVGGQIIGEADLRFFVMVS